MLEKRGFCVEKVGFKQFYSISTYQLVPEIVFILWKLMRVQESKYWGLIGILQMIILTFQSPIKRKSSFTKKRYSLT